MIVGFVIFDHRVELIAMLASCLYLVYTNDSQPVSRETFKKTLVHCFITFFTVNTTFLGTKIKKAETEPN